MLKDEILQGEERQKYFAALEDTWTRTAKEKGLKDQIIVVDSGVKEFSGLYDVLHIDGEGIAKRVGGYVGTDFGGAGPWLGQTMQDLGTEGIRILQEQGFPALLKKAQTDNRVYQISHASQTQGRIG